jgi:oligopeptidase B
MRDPILVVLFGLGLAVGAALAAGCGAQSGSSADAPRGPAGAGAAPLPAPPLAAKRPYEHRSAFGARPDPYHWLRDDTRKDKDVLAHLAAENSYTAAVLAPTAALQDQLYKEIVARIQQDDSTVPQLDRGFWYYARFETGKEYPIHCRRKDEGGAMSGAEQVLLDGNERAAGLAYYRTGATRISHSGRFLAFTEDRVGRFQYELHVRDLETGAFLPDTAAHTSGEVEWANDDRHLFYVAKDEKTLRPYRVHRHELGAVPGSDALVYEEKDATFYTSLVRTKSRAYVVILLGSTLTSEQRLIDATRPKSAPVVFLPRETGHEYEADHLDGRWVIRTNWQAKNFRVMTATERTKADRSKWRDLVPHRDDALVERLALYHDFVAVGERSGGLRKVRVVPTRGAQYVVAGDEPTYTMTLVDTPEPSSTRVRYEVESLATPASTFELDVKSGAKTLLKRTPVLGGFDARRYVTEYLHAPARDGTLIPISLVRRADLRRDGTAPILVSGYGSYGSSSDPRFAAEKVSLLDRGFVHVIAHVRGGEEMGRRWYEDGKLLHKKNTFTDFIDVTEYLVGQKIGARGKVFASGGSAGGLLMGAIANMRPDLYRGIIAYVPFVDVITTMLDETIPLTTNEYDEWGDPRKKEFYDYMLSYSPYDNIAPRAYPSILVLTGLWDSQVQYFEPAKWVARLRANKTDDNLLLLDVNMTAGHGGKSGRYQRYRDVARDYAFLLHVLERPDHRGAATPRGGGQAVSSSAPQ